MSSASPKTRFQIAATLWVPCGLFFIFRLSHFLLEVPLVRMIEYAVCHQQLDKDSVHGGLAGLMGLDESACKTDAVQRQVSHVLGWRISFDSIPGVLSVLYYGNLAEKYGHCNVLTACCVGYTMALLWTLMTCFFYSVFPIQTMWLAACFLLLGGGSLVFNSMMTSFTAHLANDQSRSTRLFILAAMPHIAKLVSPPIATALMTQSIYLPSLLSGSLVILCAGLLQIAKVLLQGHEPDTSEAGRETEPLLNDDTNPSSSSEPNRLPTSEQDGEVVGNTQDMSIMQRASKYVRSSVARLCSRPDLAIACLVFFLSKNAAISENFMFQYLSERFGWPLRHTTILRFTWSFGALAATMFLAPSITTALGRKNIPKTTIGLGIARASLILLIACFVAAWRTSIDTVFILSMFGAGLGQGLDPALQGLLSAGVPSKDTGRLFSYMYMGILLGDTTGGPLMSELISVGRSPTSPSHGYNFLASAVILGIIGLATFKNLLFIGRASSNET